jgi:hypothetical protein
MSTQDGKLFPGRFDFVERSDRATELDQDMTHMAVQLENFIEKLYPKSREASLALTKLEECVMWARKALREVK